MMQISGTSSRFSGYLPERANAINGRAAQFEQLVASAAQGQSAAAASKTDVDSKPASSAAKPDFTQMTPAEFKAEGVAMYKRGEIDFDTMSAIVLRSGSIERMDAEAGLSGDHDFTAIFQGYMDFLVQSGRKNDTASGYDTLQKVMDKIA